MSREIFEIVQGMDLKNIETQLALQCAPLITGLKISNMLIVSNKDEKLSADNFKNEQVFLAIVFYRMKRRSRFFCSAEINWRNFLEREDVSEVLREEGYVEIQLGRILSIFQMRYRAYMNGSKIFPHEMGLLLGYPVEDVTGFMVHGGKNSLYSGYWKVYADVARKLEIFKQFEMAKEMLIRLVSSGVSMEEIIGYYNENTLQTAVV